MLELQKHPVKIMKLNPRSEFHGDEEVLALDIKIAFDIPNSALDRLSPTLREALYEASNDPDLLGSDAEHLTHVKNPQLGTLKWAGEYSPCGLHMHTGNGRAKGDVLFGNATVGKITIKPKEGGTCACVARAQVLPTPDEVGRLSALLRRAVPVSLDTSAASVDGGDDSDE